MHENDPVAPGTIDQMMLAGSALDINSLGGGGWRVGVRVSEWSRTRTLLDMMPQAAKPVCFLLAYRPVPFAIPIHAPAPAGRGPAAAWTSHQTRSMQEIFDAMDHHGLERDDGMAQADMSTHVARKLKSARLPLLPRV